ncbi:MAG: hypothetical protein ACT4NY_00610 [Pseudonocardiales bacterium]
MNTATPARSRWAILLRSADHVLLLGPRAVADGVAVLRGLLYGLVDRGPYTDSQGGPTLAGAWAVRHGPVLLVSAWPAGRSRRGTVQTWTLPAR